MPHTSSPSTIPLSRRVFSAAFYGITSTVIVFVNKILLTNYQFPSFLAFGLGQMVSSVMIINVLCFFNLSKVPVFDLSIPKKVFPLPLIFVGNLLFGLGGVQHLSLPMLTVLRRISILLTMILEYIVLGVVSSGMVRVAVALMILGSFIAAIFDLSFDAVGYSFVIANDVFTAANGVCIKKKLDAKDLGKDGLIYYNSLFMMLPVFVLSWITGDLYTTLLFVTGPSMTWQVWFCLIASYCAGFILNYSSMLCTQCNSALTTSCIGAFKNTFVIYGGMFVSGDYVFSVTNFIGINICVVGSLLYTFVTFRPRATKKTSAKPDEQPLI